MAVHYRKVYGMAKIVTLGCRLNQLESHMLEQQSKGLNDVIIVNTCSVTAEAERQARQTIRRLKRENKEARIVVTGCAAQVNPLQFSEMNEVHKVIGNREKMEIARYIPLEPDIDSEGQGKIAVSPREMLTETAHHFIPTMNNRTRAFVQIQQGCDHKCSFCIIREARGPSYSLQADKILEQVRQLVDFGHKEIVLTGVDISSWGKDFKEKPLLGELIALILRDIPDLQRLRLSSLDPAAEDEALLDVLKSSHRLMPHLHLSLQAAQDRVLANMGRRHNVKSVSAWIEKLRQARPFLSLGADMICGFPKETDAQFEETYRFIAEHNIPLLHVFPYSARKGTAAAKMRAIPKALRKERAQKLRQLGEELKEKWLQSFVGTSAEILVEAGNKGYNPHYAPVIFEENQQEGQIITATFTEVKESKLISKECP